LIVATIFHLFRWLVVGRPDGGPWSTMMFRMRISAAVLGSYWIVLFVLTHVPGKKLDGLPMTGDKLAHFGAFLVLGVLLAWTASAHRRLRPAMLLLLWTVIVAYAAVDEWLQMYVPDRFADWRDGLADGLGGAAGLLLFAVATARRHRER
jgi:VanZ family protein